MRRFNWVKFVKLMYVVYMILHLSTMCGVLVYTIYQKATGLKLSWNWDLFVQIFTPVSTIIYLVVYACEDAVLKRVGQIVENSKNK